ncbi:MAG: ATP-binding protein, partial [Ignavibacteria bacterium]|nr:ATP-binding protein [Ignavibacteria bacterium]
LSRWLNTVRVRINALPFPYRRLFRIEPLEDRSFFGGRFEDLEAVEEDFRSWRETSVGAMALVGEKGSGKTTILQCATKEVYQSLPVHRINLAGRSVYAEQDLLNILLETLGGAQGESFDDLEQRLANLPHPMVVLIEDIQNLFMRKVGGFSALERLLLLISTTSHSVYWVVTSTRYTWRYFEKVLTIPRFFRREIHLAGIAHEEIENIIMSRHRISGYDLRFQPPPSIEQSKKYQQMETEEEKQAYLMEDCLDRINEVASGNITLAMLCWLSACIEVKDDTVFVSFTPPDSNTLNQFPATDLFALAAVLQHETLSAAEHAEIFHQDLQESLLLIRRLVAKGLLIEQGNLFRINPLLYRSAVRTLTSKNIIH